MGKVRVVNVGEKARAIRGHLDGRTHPEVLSQSMSRKICAKLAWVLTRKKGTDRTCNLVVSINSVLRLNY